MSKYVVDEITNICYKMLYHHRFRFCSGQSERLSWPASPSASPGWSWPPPPPYSPFTSAGSDTGHDVDLQLRLLDLRVHKNRSLKNLMQACFFDVDAIPRSCQPPYIPFTISMRHNFAQLPPFWVNSNHQSFVLLGRRENCIISFHSKVSNAPTFIAGCANSKCHCQ